MGSEQHAWPPFAGYSACLFPVEQVRRSGHLPGSLLAPAGCGRARTLATALASGEADSNRMHVPLLPSRDGRARVALMRTHDQPESHDGHSSEPQRHPQATEDSGLDTTLRVFLCGGPMTVPSPTPSSHRPVRRASERRTLPMAVALFVRPWSDVGRADARLLHNRRRASLARRPRMLLVQATPVPHPLARARQSALRPRGYAPAAARLSEEGRCAPRSLREECTSALLHDARPIS